MGARSRHELVNELAASAHVLTSAVAEVLENRLLQEVSRSRLSVSQLKLLKLVALTQRHTLGDVATFLGVSNAAASKAVDKLVRRSLLRRSEAPADRRVMELALTPTAVRLLETYDEARAARLKGVAGHFHPEDLARAGEVLERAAAALLDKSAGPERACVQCGIYFRPRCLLRELVPRTCFYESRGLRKVTPAAASGQERGA